MQNKAQNIVRDILSSQLFGVLNTWNGIKPYSNLVAFVQGKDISDIYFATIRNTRKYNNLIGFPDVSFLVDNRSNREEDLTSATAISCHGTARECGSAEYVEISQVFLEKHPSLRSFIENPDCAIFKVDVSEFIIAGFSETSIYRV